MVERPISPEVKKAPEIIANLRNAYGVSHRIYANSFGPDAPTEVINPEKTPENLVNIVSQASRVNRQEYWGEENWGQQMLTWLNGGVDKDGKKITGMKEWLVTQVKTFSKEDPRIAILGSVGLMFGEKLAQKDQNDLGVLIEKLQAQGVQMDLQDRATVGSLIFYSRYLDAATPEDQQEKTQRLLIDVINGAAYDVETLPEDLQDRTKHADEIFTRIQSVAPLLRVTGEEAQLAIAALIAAEIHGEFEPEKVTTAAAAKPLADMTPDEQEIIALFRKYTNQNVPPEIEESDEPEEAPADAPPSDGDPSLVPPLPSDKPDDDHSGPPAPLPKKEELVLTDDSEKTSETAELKLLPGQQYRVTEVMDMVPIPATSEGNPYFFATPPTEEQILSAAQEIGLSSLQYTGEAFVNAKDGFGKYGAINPKLFPADQILSEDTRYLALRDLVEDGYLMALSGSSAENSPKQAEVYRALAKVVLEVHQQHPELFRAFLEAQKGPDGRGTSSETYLRNREGSVADREREVLIQQLAKERFNVDDPMNLQFDQYISLEKDAEITHGINNNDGRLLALKREGPQVETSGALNGDSIDVDATVAGWQGRVEKLRELLSQPDTQLTLEQMRQIEFLALSVDVNKVFERLKGQPLEAAESVEEEAIPVVEPEKQQSLFDLLGISDAKDFLPDVPSHKDITTYNVDKEIERLARAYPKVYLVFQGELQHLLAEQRPDKLDYVVNYLRDFWHMKIDKDNLSPVDGLFIQTGSPQVINWLFLDLLRQRGEITQDQWAMWDLGKRDKLTSQLERSVNDKHNGEAEMLVLRAQHLIDSGLIRALMMYPDFKDSQKNDLSLPFSYNGKQYRFSPEEVQELQTYIKHRKYGYQVYAVLRAMNAKIASNPPSQERLPQEQ